VSVTQIKGGIDGWRMTGSGFTIPYFLALQAEACRVDGRTDEALALVAEALQLIGKTDEGFFAGELHRLEGELRREKSGRADEAGIEECFQRALEAARGEGARAFELRAATSLARLWSEQGKGGEARRLLVEAMAPLEGGTATLDLAEARALLETLPGA
jgi:predicted ATPase